MAMADDSSNDNVVDLDAARRQIADLARLDSIAYGQQRKTAAKTLGISVALLDKEVTKHRRVRPEHPTKNLILNERGVIMPVLANAIEILRQHGQDFRLRYEEFSQRIFIYDRPLDDADLLHLAEWLQRQGCLAGRRVTDDAIISVAHETRFHVVKDWLKTLAWDRVSRLETLLIDHAGAADTPLVRAFTSKWLIQAIARIEQPGCQADATLVLEGDQGGGKSSLFRTLFGDDWFTDHLPNLDSKDAQIQLLGIWCIELSELAAISGKESAKTKQFLTSRNDRFRLPFEKVAKNHPRSSVFAGTINPGAMGWGKDETGARRYWPVAVTHIDLGQIADRRDQIWAEALHRYRAGETWHIGEGDNAEAAKAAQAERYVGDPWQEVITAYVRGRDFVTLKDIFINALDMPDKSRWSQLEQNRIARCLSHMGWTRKLRRIATTLLGPKDHREWGYVPPVVTDTEPPLPNNESLSHQSPLDNENMEREW